MENLPHLRERKPSESLCAYFSTCFLVALGFLCLKSRDVTWPQTDEQDLPSYTAWLCTGSALQQSGKALGHGSACLQRVPVMKRAGAWHSPPVSEPQSSSTRRKSRRGGSGGAGREKSFRGALLVLLTPRDLSQGVQRINYSMRYTTTTSLETL